MRLGALMPLSTTYLCISKKKLGKCAEGKDNRDNLSTFEWEEATAHARLSRLSFLWANLPNPFC
jgi:hypothetical protein